MIPEQYREHERNIFFLVTQYKLTYPEANRIYKECNYDFNAAELEARRLRTITRIVQL